MTIGQIFMSICLGLFGLICLSRIVFDWIKDIKAFRAEDAKLDVIWGCSE